MYLKVIQSLCKQSDITIGRLEKKLGFSNGSIFKWVNSSPSVDRLQKVANYFGVTVDYLLSDSDLSPESIMVAQKFDNLSENQKQAVSKVLNSYSVEASKEANI